MLASLAASLAGVNVTRSLWGNFERMGGTYYLLHLTLLSFYIVMLAQIGGNYIKYILYMALAVAAVILVAIAFVYRPLLFASLDEDVAEAKGMPMLAIGIIFMLLVAVATSIAVQVVGVLLIFALMVTPAAIAQQLTKKPAIAVLISVIVALAATWAGLIISFYEPYPVSFFITTIVFVLYLLVRFVYPKLKPAKPAQKQNIHVHSEAD